MCQVLDVPKTLSEQLSSKEVATLCKGKDLPGKVAGKLLDLCSKHFNFGLENQDEPERECKRTKVEEEELRPDSDTRTELSLREDKENERKLKAAKADDAEVPVYLWDSVLVPDSDPTKIAGLNDIRQFALRWVKRHTLRDFLHWFRQNHPHVNRWMKSDLGLPHRTWFKGLQVEITKD
jgi:hypothetical protein